MDFEIKLAEEKDFNDIEFLTMEYLIKILKLIKMN